jgi:hypothetical protein
VDGPVDPPPPPEPPPPVEEGSKGRSPEGEPELLEPQPVMMADPTRAESQYVSRREFMVCLSLRFTDDFAEGERLDARADEVFRLAPSVQWPLRGLNPDALASRGF